MEFECLFEASDEADERRRVQSDEPERPRKLRGPVLGHDKAPENGGKAVNTAIRTHGERRCRRICSSPQLEIVGCTDCDLSSAVPRR